MSGRRHRVVVIGAGFGGLATARALGDAPVDVTIIEANNFHTFQPLLYQVATAGLDSGNVAYAVRGIFRRQRNVDVKMARVTGIDLAARTVAIDTGDPVGYDTLVIAAGAVSTSFGVPGVDEYAYPLKQLDDAIAVRRRIIDQFERAAADPSLVDDGALNVVVCGGGPTGVEMAGGLMELFDKVLQHDFPDLPVRWARVVLVEAADRLLSPFSEQSSSRALGTLTRRRVEVRLGVGVQEVGPTRVTLADGTVIPAHTVIWAAGVAASPLAAMVGTETTRGGRLVVEHDLSLPGHPEVFAIGDIAAAALLSKDAEPEIVRSPRSPNRRSRVGVTSPRRSGAGWPGRAPNRSATTTRGRWRRSVASTRSSTSRTASTSTARSGGLPGSACTSCTSWDSATGSTCSSTGAGTI